MEADLPLHPQTMVTNSYSNCSGYRYRQSKGRVSSSRSPAGKDRLASVVCISLQQIPFHFRSFHLAPTPPFLPSLARPQLADKSRVLRCSGANRRLSSIPSTLADSRTRYGRPFDTIRWHHLIVPFLSQIAVSRGINKDRFAFRVTLGTNCPIL